MVCAVVKADAYGFGMVKVCELLKGSVDYFAVAKLSEFLKYKELEIDKPCLILSPLNIRELKIAINAGAEIGLFCEEDVSAIEAFQIFSTSYGRSVVIYQLLIVVSPLLVTMKSILAWSSHLEDITLVIENSYPSDTE